jgi:hypothetical protein
VFDPAATKPGPCSQTESALDWNQTGPQGPQAIQGPQGPQGIQGPKGDPATIDNLKTIVVRKDVTVFAQYVAMRRETSPVPASARQSPNVYPFCTHEVLVVRH